MQMLTNERAELKILHGGMAEILVVASTTTTTARERAEKYNLLHKGFFKLGAPLTVVLVCFAQGVGRYI